MKRTRLLTLTGLLLMCSLFSQESGITPEEILDHIDANMVFKSAYSNIEMVLTIGSRTITKTMTSHSAGSEKSFIEFLSPARDKGTKILKLDGIIRIYYPSAERVMRLSGHMLRQSMMGSDFSYEDMTERSRKLREEYEAVLIGEDQYNKHSCYVLELTSKIENQTYHRRKIWVDKTLFLGMKEELYARSGKLLKVLRVDEVKSFKGRHYPVRLTMEDKLRQGSKTEMRVTDIDFDLDLPDTIFSERNLLRR